MKALFGVTWWRIVLGIFFSLLTCVNRFLSGPFVQTKHTQSRIGQPRAQRLVSNSKPTTAGVLLALLCKVLCSTGCPQVAKFNRSQNKVEEFFSLVHFLKVGPLNDWGIFKTRIVDPLKKGRAKAPMKRLHVCLRPSCSQRHSALNSYLVGRFEARHVAKVKGRHHQRDPYPRSSSEDHRCRKVRLQQTRTKIL